MLSGGTASSLIKTAAFVGESAGKAVGASAGCWHCVVVWFPGLERAIVVARRNRGRVCRLVCEKSQW